MHALGDQLRVDRGRLVLDVDHLHLVAGLEVRQRAAGSRWEVAFLGRDRVAVRVERRMAQPHRQFLGLLGGRPVLPALRLRMPAFRLHPRLIREVALPQPVNADDAQRLAASFRGQPEASFRRHDEPQPLHAGKEFGAAPAAEPQHPDQALVGRLAALVLAVEEVLQRVLGAGPLQRPPTEAPAPEPAVVGTRHEDGQRHDGGEDDEGEEGVHVGQIRAAAGSAFTSTNRTFSLH